MKKLYKFILLVILLLNIIAFSEGTILPDWNQDLAYRPMPVIFVHGIWSDAMTWQDALGDENSNLIQYFFKYDNTPAGILAPILPWPSRQYLETFDYSSTMWERIYTNGPRLNNVITQVLERYYGVDFRNNPNAKVRLVCHSAGGLLARYYIQEKFKLVQPHYVKRIVMIGVPNLGSGWVNTVCFLGYIINGKNV